MITAIDREPRANGWEQKLNDQLLIASKRRFNKRKWNCARFAHACVVAVSGRDMPWPRKKPGSLESNIDALLPRVEPLFAQRGDVVMANLPEPMVGICIGPKAAFVLRQGLTTVPMSSVTRAWGV